MEREKLQWTVLLWAAVIVQIAMSTDVTNSTSTESSQAQIIEDTSSSGYAWSSWSTWTKCSRTCGGGVSVQERQCLPRSLSPVNGTLPSPIVTVRVTRQIHHHDCFGEDRRYRECNTEPCFGSARGLRAEQCAKYDRRPFRGRFYTWVPYIDGDNPCLLNCRPLGQQFYASLGLVADGTPCTKPGTRAICAQGVCKTVGMESVLAGAATRELRCGRRLVSGLFARPRLPLGYSYVTTVPRGACRLNVSEIVSTENYIALKISNGSYIINGEFAVSSPGTYDAVGSRFIYTRAAGLDQVFTAGPILHPIDIMILYTQPIPSIKYEFLTESINGEADIDTPRSDQPDNPVIVSTKHTRRHHSFDTLRPGIPRHPDLVSMSKEDNSDSTLGENVIGDRTFMWKVLTYSQCTRSCGGGFQIGKYKCMETSGIGPEKEVSAIHCSGAAPSGRRRRCGNTQCPPRWRAAAWSSCPKCGPATRKRIVGCVQDHSKGITKISDHKCPPPRPHTSETCNIPNCDEITISSVRNIEPNRVKAREHTETFRDGPVYSIAVNSSDFEIGPEYSFSATAGWLLTDWSECVGWCVGDGIQSRGVRCADPSGCAPRRAPDSSRSCVPKTNCEPQEGEWFVGEWSHCSSNCNGKQIRGVLCVGGTGRHLKDSACKSPRPPSNRSCGTECPPTWYFSDWSKCSGNCSLASIGVQRRTVVCTRGNPESEEAVSDTDCTSTRPKSDRTCDLECSIQPTLPPDLTVEYQKLPDPELTTTTTTQKVYTRESNSKDCADKLSNCVLAVQARLCHYNFYVKNCCDSCRGR